MSRRTYLSQRDIEFTGIKSIQNSLSVHTIFNVVENLPKTFSQCFIKRNKEAQIITEVDIYKAYEIFKKLSSVCLQLLT
jgi:hypothetical protein